jgi:peroxin-3
MLLTDGAAITRSFLLIYVLSLLTLLTRIQLNLLGRRNYLSSVMSLASPPANATTISLEDHDDDDLGQAFGNDFETNRRYLTFSWWLLNRAWKDLMAKVEKAVKEVFGSFNPREDTTLEKLSRLTLEVRKKVEGSTEEERRWVDLPSHYLVRTRTDLHRVTKWLPYLLPPKEEEDTVLRESGVLDPSTPSSPQTAATLRHLLDETSDLIESPSFTRILTLLNNEGFSVLIDQKCAASAFKPATAQPLKTTPESFSSTATIVPAPGSSSHQTKLATVLAVLTREAHNIGNGTNPPNEYLAAMEQNVRELEAFAAVVYSSNFDLKTPPPDLESATMPTTGVGSVPPSPAPIPSRGNAAAPGKHGESHVVDPGLSSSPSSETVSDPLFEKAWGKVAAVSEKNDNNCS